ncbi:hypothetical protein JCM6882_001254 [Rhodosporidiobolus microsporus]
MADLKTGSITVVWTIRDFKTFLETDVDGSSARLQSPAFDNGRWKITFKLFMPDGSSLIELAESTGRTYGSTAQSWGWLKAVGVAALLQDVRFSTTSNIVCRTTVSFPPFAPLPPFCPPPPVITPKLLQSYHGFFEDPSTCDVRFAMANDADQSRILFANIRFLASRCEYFRTMFASGFAEGSPSPTTLASSNPRMRKRRKIDVATDPTSPWQNDDDSLEWLPEEWMASHGVPELRTEDEEDVGFEATEGVLEQAGGDGEAEAVIERGGQDKPATSIKRAITVTDAGFTTYRAMLYFLYTERITFTPLASSFTVALVTNNETGPNSSRRAFLLSNAKKTSDPVEAASPHAVYRLADKLDIPELKKRAKEAITSGFTTRNILYELISTFSYHYDEIQNAALKYAWANWDDVKATPAFNRVFAGAAQIEGGSTILAKLVMGLSAASTGGGGEGKKA